MARGTEFGSRSQKKICPFACMRGMATATRALLKWEMNLPSLKSCHHRLVAGKTEFLFGLGQHFFIGTGMRIVALDAFTRSHWPVNIGLIKLILLLRMALVTKVTPILGQQFAYIAGMGGMTAIAIALAERGMNDLFLQPVLFFFVTRVAKVLF